MPVDFLPIRTYLILHGFPPSGDEFARDVVFVKANSVMVCSDTRTRRRFSSRNREKAFLV